MLGLGLRRSDWWITRMLIFLGPLTLKNGLLVQIEVRIAIRWYMQNRFSHFIHLCSKCFPFFSLFSLEFCSHFLFSLSLSHFLSLVIFSLSLTHYLSYDYIFFILTYFVSSILACSSLFYLFNNYSFFIDSSPLPFSLSHGSPSLYHFLFLASYLTLCLWIHSISISLFVSYLFLICCLFSSLPLFPLSH